jgi:ribosomal protein bL25 (Ctc-form)
VDPKALQKVLRSEAGRNAILKLEIPGAAATNAILKSWQVDPIKETFLHADFYRIAMDVAIRVTVPIQVRGEARGVKVDGGILELILREIAVECLPGDIPEHIDVDVSDLGINGALRVSDVPVSDKVKILETRIRSSFTCVGEGRRRRAGCGSSGRGGCCSCRARSPERRARRKKKRQQNSSAEYPARSHVA